VSREPAVGCDDLDVVGEVLGGPVDVLGRPGGEVVGAGRGGLAGCHFRILSVDVGGSVPVDRGEGSGHPLGSRPPAGPVLSAAATASARGVEGLPVSCCRSVLSVYQSPWAMARLVSASRPAKASGMPAAVSALA